MGKILRALFISAVATGVAAYVVRKLHAPAFPPPPRDVLPKAPGTVDADAYDEQALKRLTDELAAQL